MHSMIACCFGLMFMQCYNLIATHMWWPYSSILQGLEYLSMNIAAIAISYVANYLVVFCRRRKMGLSPIWNLLLDILKSFSLLLVLDIPFLYLMSYIATHSSYIDWIGAIFYNAFCLLGMEIVFYVRQYTLNIKKVNAAKEQMLRYQYDALRAQVNPHFLFNSLNIIQALTQEDSDRAVKAIQCLSDIYRYVLDNSRLERVSVKEDWNHALSYIELLKIRYEGNFEIKVEGDIVEYAGIVPMTFQILIENVFKHNTISRNKVMQVLISFKNDGIIVSNTIRRKENPRSTEFGLRYLKDLYANQGKILRIEDDASTFSVYVPYFNSRRNVFVDSNENSDRALKFAL